MDYYFFLPRAKMSGLTGDISEVTTEATAFDFTFLRFFGSRLLRF